MNLIDTLEMLDPGHFSRREVELESLRKNVRTLGFFPLPLSRNDIECLWVRLEAKDYYSGSPIYLTEESYFDVVNNANFFEILKKMAKHETCS